MKKSFAIFASLTVLILFSATPSYSLPGIAQTITDDSGVFVYYKDSTFQRESYFGMAYYNEETVAVRYFAPAQTDTYPLTPKKDIQILFSLDSSKKYIELTGERILTAITPDDTDIVNYLHDMVYELHSKRKKAGILEEKTVLSQEYEQFGGSTLIEYDPIIPLFSIKSISSPQGTKLFTLVTTGKLVSSSDDSFSQFSALPITIKDDIHIFTQNKKLNVKKQKIEYAKTENITQKITLDSQWTKSADNLYCLQDKAILAMDILDFSSIENLSEQNFALNRFRQNLTLGKEASYPYSQLFTVEQKGGFEIFSNIFFNDVAKTFTKDFKILHKIDSSTYGIMTLSIFYGTYSKNKKYFDSIIKSYGLK